MNREHEFARADVSAELLERELRLEWAQTGRERDSAQARLEVALRQRDAVFAETDL